MCKCTPEIRTPFCGKPDCAMPPQAGKPVSPPEKLIRKYTIEEFWASLSWEIGDQDGDYDGLLHVSSNINGTEVKIPIHEIVHAASKSQAQP